MNNPSEYSGCYPVTNPEKCYRRNNYMETLKKQAVLPRWRGFNLLDMFHAKSTGDFNGHKLDRELLKFLREF